MRARLGLAPGVMDPHVPGVMRESPRSQNDLATRAGLPEALQVLVRQYPRDIWQSHRNFDALTRFWLERHLMFRQLLDRLRGETETLLDGNAEARGVGARTSRLTGFLLGELHGHHQIEDVHYFPVLARLEPRLAAGFELLDSDHHALDGHLHDLADSTNDLLRAIVDGQQAPARDAAGALQARLAGFEGFLDRHLIDEEELVIPTILHHAPRF